MGINDRLNAVAKTFYADEFPELQNGELDFTTSESYAQRLINIMRESGHAIRVEYYSSGVTASTLTQGGWGETREDVRASGSSFPEAVAGLFSRVWHGCVLKPGVSPGGA